MVRLRALENIRVIDFTWVRAGPWATRWLGAFGAEVIKIEWPENERGRLPSTTTPQNLEVNLNTSGNFNDTNVNKKSLSLNGRSAKGLEIVNGAMSGSGHTGRHHHYTPFGPVAQAVSGLTYLSGLPDKPPAGWGWSYMDDTGGMYGAMCALTGLYHRNMTGQGQHIDLSQMVASVPLVGPALLDFTVNGRGSHRAGFPPGNGANGPGTPLVNNYRGPTVAPHNAYRTDPGEYNDWCVIVCHSDEEWQQLVQVMGAPSWSISPKFATVTGRLQHQEELDEHIEAWSMTLGKYELTERCQAAGVRALPVQSAEDRVEHDPQLRHREMYLAMAHPALGLHKVQNAPFKLSETPPSSRLPSPPTCQEARQIVAGLLGYSHEDLRAGFPDVTFWPTNRARL